MVAQITRRNTEEIFKGTGVIDSEPQEEEQSSYTGIIRITAEKTCQKKRLKLDHLHAHFKIPSL